MAAITEVGACFRRARGDLTLREIEETTKVNRETWRSYEVGRLSEPGEEIMLAAAQLPNAPSAEDFVTAILADKRRRLMAAAGMAEGGPRRAQAQEGRGRMPSKSTA